MSEDLPLVTFALFAYNQEKYIREAVESALAQDYPNLEVIISDDCSTDDTWSVISDLVDGYRGKHIVSLNRNEKNLGIIGHVNKVATLSSGDVVVMAAGDDISASSRASDCVASMLASNAYAAYSAVQKMDSQGQHLQGPTQMWMPERPITLDHLIGGAGGVGIGASYAYRKECFRWPWPMPETLVSEDKLLPLRAHLLGGIAYVDRALVQYRVTGGSVTDHLLVTKTRPGSREDHLEELRRTLVRGHEQGLVATCDLYRLLRMLRTLPRMNVADAATNTWHPALRRLALKVVGNLLNWRTIPYRFASKLGLGAASK